MNKNRNRGTYDPELHMISNNFGLIVARMFYKQFDAVIKKVIVNQKYADGKTLVVDDYKWDVILSVEKNKLPKHLQDIIYCDKQFVVLAIEIEAKLVRIDIWILPICSGLDVLKQQILDGLNIGIIIILMNISRILKRFKTG